MAENQEFTVTPMPEVRKINHLLEKYKYVVGTFNVVPVGESGYVVTSNKRVPLAGADWLLFDYDDTFCATSEVKKQRLQLYIEYAKNSGINATDEQLEDVMEATDKFSRWEDIPEEGNIYHADVHTAVLNWATQQIKQGNKDSIQNTLDRIKKQLKEEGESNPDDPFRFQGKKFILSGGIKIPWDPKLEEIFFKTMINPPRYTETIDAAKEAYKDTDSYNRVNIGVFTYGDPHYQLLKVLELMQTNPDLPINQIWLTRIRKGAFIEQLIKTQATSSTRMEYIPQTQQEDRFESPSYGFGFPLGKLPHAIVMFDDSPKELESILSKNSYIKENTEATFAVVRSKRKGTKEEKTQWQVQTAHGEIDFTGEKVPQYTEVHQMLRKALQRR